MKISYNCLSRYINIPCSPDELAKKLTMAGTNVEDIYYIDDDVVYDLEITPNRPDLLSYLGILFEIRAIFYNHQEKIDIKLGNHKDYINSNNYNVKIEDIKNCSDYKFCIMDNIAVTESPDWLKRDLNNIGLNSVNNIVDIINYVLIELGIPAHVFDREKIAGHNIYVKKNIREQEIELINGSIHKIDKDCLTITDDSKVLALAGITGCKNSCVTVDTKNIFIECAYFNPYFIRQTSKRLSIHTDTSYRFERGINVNLLNIALNRIVELILNLPNKPTPLSPKIICIDEQFDNFIDCKYDEIRSIIGINSSNLPNNIIIDIIKALNFKIEHINDDIIRFFTSNRRNDIQTLNDLSEEVVRIYGLDKIPSYHINFKTGEKYNNFCKKNDNKIKHLFINDEYSVIEETRNKLVSLGLIECINNSLISKNEVLSNNMVDCKDIVEIANPINEFYSALRPSLIFGMLKVIERNIALGNNELKLFEIGKIYNMEQDEVISEKYSCCITITGHRNYEKFYQFKNNIDFYDIKGVLESYLLLNNYNNYKCVKSYNKLLDFNQQAKMIDTNTGSDIAYFGQLSDVFTSHIRLDDNIYIALVDLEELFKINNLYKFVRPTQYPSIIRDFTIVLDECVDTGDIINFVENNKDRYSIIKSIFLKDIFRDDDKIGKNKKSVTYFLIYNSNKRTLTDIEVNRLQEEIVSQIQHLFYIIK